MSSTSKTQPVLGLWTLTALVAGNMIGSGVFLLPSALGSIGSIGILAWLLTSIGAIFIALVFAKMSIWIPKVGGPYAYCRESFGEFTGFQIAYNYWIALWVGNAAIVVALVGYLGYFFPQLNHDRFLDYLVGISILWLLTFVNAVGVKQAGIVQLITTILKLLPLLLIAFIGIFFIYPHHLVENFNVTQTSNWTALTSAATLTLWSFIGLESATVPAESVIAPTRNIPRATIIGTVITAVVYILSTTAVMGIMNIQSLKTSTAPYADAATMMFGHWGGLIVALGAVISCFGALNGWTLLQGQVPYAAAKDGLFPASFVKETRGGTPIVGLIVSSILITLLLTLTLTETLVKQFTFITLLATLASLVPYYFTAMAELKLLVQLRKEFNPRRFAITATIAIIASLYAFWAIYGAGQETVYYGMLLFFSSIPVYIWMKWKESFK